MVVCYKHKVKSVPCFVVVLNPTQYDLAGFQWVEDCFKGCFTTPVKYSIVHGLLERSFLLFVHRQERRRVQVLSAKIALVCLCAAKLQDKYQYLFTQLADHNNCLSRRKLHALLDSMVAITDYLSESLAFSPDLISATVDSCFQQVSCLFCVQSPF